MNTTTNTIGNTDIRTVTVGVFRSRHQGEILLVYLNDGETDPTVKRYDQLSGNERYFVRTAAQDPLSLLKQTKMGRQASRRAA